MNCILSCINNKQKLPLLFPDLTIYDEVMDEICMLCKNSLIEKVVKCNLCNRVIGHLSCVKKWLKNNKKCPNCNENFIKF